MKQDFNYVSQGFTYENELEREKHISAMKQLGWKVGPQSKRLKEEVNIWNATDEDYEWIAVFNKNMPIDLSPGNVFLKELDN